MSEENPNENCGICGSDDIWFRSGPPNKEINVICETCGAIRVGVIEWKKWKRRE